MPLEQPEHVLHDGPVGHRQQRLGHTRGHRAKAGALATGHYDGLHVGSVLLEETAIMPTMPCRGDPWFSEGLPDPQPKEESQGLAGSCVHLDQTADLDHVEDSCPPVQSCTPAGERPSENSSE